MKEQRNTLSYGVPLEVNFENVPDHDLDDYSGERTRVYGVVVLFTTPKYTQKIQYEITVSYLKKDYVKNYWTVQLQKSKVYINQANTDRVIDKINEEFMLQVLHPVELAISNTGTLLGILNFEEITKRFQKFITLKRKEYTGIYATRFFALLEQKMNSAYTLQSSMEKDWFWATFFTPVYFPKGYFGNKKTDKLFPAFNSFENCMLYNGQINVSKTYTRENTVLINHKATNENENADISIEYELNATSFLINEIRSKAQLKSREHEITKTIETTIIHLREKDRNTPKKKKKRISFWS